VAESTAAKADSSIRLRPGITVKIPISSLFPDADKQKSRALSKLRVSTRVSPLGRQSFRNNGSNADNRQKIEVRDDMLRYYVNDTYIGEIKSVLDMKEWFLDLTV
jgi:hypothetical protein